MRGPSRDIVQRAESEFRLIIRRELEEGLSIKQRILSQHIPVLERIARRLVWTLRKGGKILFFGNGGSAADSQHLATELVSRFRRQRRALPAVALTTDTSILTAIGNDYGFEYVFARQIAALGEKEDTAVAISTSGNSPNVIQAIDKARELGLVTVGLTGEDGGQLKDRVDLCFCVPSQNTARIQEAHIAAGHVFCELIEREFSARS